MRRIHKRGMVLASCVKGSVLGEIYHYRFDRVQKAPAKLEK